MGKIADRINRRKSPGHEPVRRLVALAKSFIDRPGDTEAFGDLFDFLEGELVARSPAAFDDFIEAFRDDIAARHDADDLNDVVADHLAQLCESDAAEDVLDAGACVESSLVALPMVISGKVPGHELVLTDEFVDGLADVARAHSLVAHDAKVSVLRRLLTVEEASVMRPGTLYRLLRALAADDHETVRGVVAAEFDDAYGDIAPPPSATGSFMSTGVIMLAVSTADSEPLPLLSELEQALEGDDEEARAAREDCDTILDSAAGGLGPLLGVDEVAFPDPPDFWGSGVSSFAILDRLLFVRAQLRLLGEPERSDAWGDVLEVLGEPRVVAEPTHGFVVEVKHKVSGLVGGFLWPARFREGPQETAEHLADFLTRNALAVTVSSSEGGVDAGQRGRPGASYLH